VRDERGRVIGIKKMAPIDRMRISGFIGGELSDNPAYFGTPLAACVREIDGEPIPMATSPGTSKILSISSDEDGLEAVANGMRSRLDQGESEKELLDEAKN
jgi:hypothetical protein